MLLKEMLRTLRQYKAQFISMALMIMLGVGVFVGFNMEWYSLQVNVGEHLQSTGFSDYRIFARTAVSGSMSPDDLFTEAERTENYINYYHKYPSWYTGKRDEAMLERMRNDFDFDQETQTIREPVGRMVGGDFVYTGEVKATRLA